MSDEREGPPEDDASAEPDPPEPPYPAGGDQTETEIDGPVEIDELSPPPVPEEPVTAEPPPPVAPPPSQNPGPVVMPATADIPVPPGAKRSWPSTAKTTVAILVVLLLAAIAGTVVGFLRASSAEDDAASSDDSLAAMTQRVEAAEGALDALRTESETRIEELIGELDTTRSQLSTALADAAEERSRLETERDAAIERAEAAEQAIDEVDEFFPVSIDPDLGVIDAAGSYRLSMVEVDCRGLDICGTPPTVDQVALARDANGTLRFVIDGLLDVPLRAIEGTMFGESDEESLIPPCGEIPRPSLVTMALFGDVGELALDGTVTLIELGASILIDVPAVEDCGAGLVWYRAQLTAPN